MSTRREIRRCALESGTKFLRDTSPVLASKRFLAEARRNGQQAALMHAIDRLATGTAVVWASVSALFEHVPRHQQFCVEFEREISMEWRQHASDGILYCCQLGFFDAAQHPAETFQEKRFLDILSEARCKIASCVQMIREDSLLWTFIPLDEELGEL